MKLFLFQVLIHIANINKTIETSNLSAFIKSFIVK